MPKRWPWIEYPVGWLQQLAWIANASWPGDDDFKQLQGYIIHARLLVREIHWSDHLGGGNKRWPSIEYTPLVSDLPCRAGRSGLKMGVGCPLTSFLLDRVEVVH
jgi:hypothetical protein